MVVETKKTAKKKTGKRRGRPPGSTKLAKILERNIASGKVKAREGEPATTSFTTQPGKTASPAAAPPRKHPDDGRFPQNPQVMNPDRLAGPDRVDGDIYFSRLDLRLFELTQERVKSAALEVQLEERENQRLMLEYEAKRLKLQDGIRRKKEVATLKSLELNTLRREIEQVYKISLRQIVYDDESGKITIDDSADDSKG